ncbi:hypothetical protein GCM10027175_08700 [Hymenobacter latericoloratus]
MYITAGRVAAQTAADTAQDRRLAQRVATQICEDLKLEDQKKSLQTLSSDQAKQLFVRLFTKVALGDEEIIAQITAAGPNSRAYGEQLGRKVGAVMLRDCPVSHPLLLRLGGEQLSKQQPISPEEAKVLKPVATAMCRDLQPRVAELKKLPTEKRREALTQAFQKNLKASAQELTKYYGADVFLDAERMKSIGMKLSALMAPDCPEAVVLFTEFAPKK